MPTIISKTGTGEPLPENVEVGELAIDLTNSKLYTKSGAIIVELGGGTGTGDVDSVNSGTGIIVDNTDPSNPIVGIDPFTVVGTSGSQSIAGTKTFSETIVGSISGNAGSVTNGVYTTGNQAISGVKSFQSWPTSPVGNPSSNYQFANKQYVDFFASDRKLKENIVSADLDKAMSYLDMVEIREYDLKDGSGHDFGFIADELAEVFPDKVIDTDDYQMIAIKRLVGLLWAQNKGLHERLKDIEGR